MLCRAPCAVRRAPCAVRRAVRRAGAAQRPPLRPLLPAPNAHPPLGTWQDMGVLARKGVWPRAKTLSLLARAADTAERLPSTPLSAHASDVGLAAAAAAAGEQPAEATVTEEEEAALVAASQHSRKSLVENLRKLRIELEQVKDWPPY